MKAYLGYLDSLRGIAAVSIVLLHFSNYLFPAIGEFISSYTSILNKTYLFVDLFFVLSGFVLTYKYADTFKTLDGAKYLIFMSKRLTRLYPLHLITLLFIAAFYLFAHRYGVLIVPDSFKLLNNKTTFVSNLFLLHSSGLFDKGCYNCTSWNYPSWSISVEFLSYLLIPFFIYFSIKSRNLLSLIILFLGSIVFYLNIKIGNLDLASWEGWIRCLLGMSIGILFARLGLHLKQLSHSWSLAFVFLLFYSMHISNFDFMSLILIYIYLAFILMEKKKRYLNNRYFQKLGKISYSIYMVHACVQFIMSFILRSISKVSLEQIEFSHQLMWFFFSVGLVIILANLSYHFIEVKLSKYIYSIKL